MQTVYGELLSKIYGTTSIDICAKMHKYFKPLSLLFSFRKESKTTTFTKSKPCSHVSSCLAMFMARSLQEVLFINNCCVFHFSWFFTLLDRAYMPLRSVSLIWESFFYGLGFDSQALNGCLQLFQVSR